MYGLSSYLQEIIYKRVLYVYNESGSGTKSYAVMGSIGSDNVITWGSKVQIYNGGSSHGSNLIFDSNSGNFIFIAASDAVLRAWEIVPTSDTTFSFSYVSSSVSASHNASIGMATDGNGNFMTIGGTNNDKGFLCNVTYDPNSSPKFNFSSVNQFFNSRLKHAKGMVYNSVQDKFVAVYGDYGTDQGKSFVAQVATNPLSTPTTGSHTTWESDNAFDFNISYDPVNDYVVIATYSRDNGNHGVIFVGQVNGTSVSYGSGNSYGSMIVMTIILNSYIKTLTHRLKPLHWILLV